MCLLILDPIVFSKSSDINENVSICLLVYGNSDRSSEAPKCENIKFGFRPPRDSTNFPMYFLLNPNRFNPELNFI